jgi:hypothetical protein
MRTIKFLPENIEKIKAGTKTQTRRILRPFPQPEKVIYGIGKGFLGYWPARVSVLAPPYGIPGDTIRLDGTSYLLKIEPLLWVERLQDIARASVIFEGIPEPSEGVLTLQESYSRLWECLHGKGSWKENPLVWIYNFSYIGTVEDELTREAEQLGLYDV